MRLSDGQKRSIVDYFKLQPEVAGVFLYGSQAGKTSGILSDVDLAVLLTDKVKSKSFDLQLEYINAVQEIVREDLAADVKILNSQQALIYQAEVINQGQLIVNNKPEEVEQFIHKVAVLYPDFYPVLQNYFTKMNQRLKEGNYALGR